VFYWPDSLNAYQQRLTPSYLSEMPTFPANEAARHLVGEITEAFIALVRKHGGTHFQLGRMYPYAQDRDVASGALLRDLKARLDPFRRQASRLISTNARPNLVKWARAFRSRPML